MSHKHTSRQVRRTAIVAVVALVLTAVALAGCGGTVASPGGPSGTGASTVTKAVPEGLRGTALTQLKSMGVTFDPGMVNVAFGASESRLVVTGPLTGPASLTTSTKGPSNTKYSEIDLALQGTAWVVTKAVR